MRRLNGLIFSCLVLLSCVGPASPISSSTSYTALLQARHGFGLFSCGALQCSPPDLCTCDGNHTHFLLDVTGDPASDAVVATLSCHNPRATPCTGPAQHNRFTVTPEDGLGIRFGRQIWLEQEAPRRTSFWDTSMVSDALTMDCPLYARLHVLEYNPVSEKACHNDPSVVLQACPVLPCAVAQKLVQRCPSLTSFNVTYQCISRALFTLHQPPTLRSGPWGCAAAGAASEALCVSDSLGLPDPDMQRALRPVLYAHQGGTIPVFPISFSLPEDLFVRAVPQKTKYFSSIMPGNGSTYLHNLEDYKAEYGRSYFAVTRKKAGWDCLRHVEVIALGAVPYVPDLQFLPPKTMVFYPRALLEEARNFPGTSFTGDFLQRESFTLDPEKFSQAAYFNLAARWLEHGRQWLTSKAMARYMLQTMGLTGVRSALVFTICLSEYLAVMTMHGFKQLLGSARVTDYAHHPPEMVRAYKRKLKTTWRTCPPPRHRGVWPGAYVGASRAVDTTWTQVLEDLQDVDRTNIAQRLARREWDVVVYALADRSAPYLDVVQRHYPPSRVALVLGNDLPEGDLAKVAGFAATGYVFQREMYDGALDGPHRNATICIPSATKCLVPPSPEPLPISRGPVYAPRE